MSLLAMEQPTGVKPASSVLETEALSLDDGCNGAGATVRASHPCRSPSAESPAGWSPGVALATLPPEAGSPERPRTGHALSARSMSGSAEQIKDESRNGASAIAVTS